MIMVMIITMFKKERVKSEVEESENLATINSDEDQHGGRDLRSFLRFSFHIMYCAQIFDHDNSAWKL